MFDMNKVASNIKSARTKRNMTQMNLADEMGVSYQAVSNWERGNSMPNISKLPELCKILDVSFEELVGEKSAESEITERLMQKEEADVDLGSLCALAPFLSKEALGKIVEQSLQSGKAKIGHIAGLAPFLSKEALQKIADFLLEHGQADKLVAIEPFMGKGALSEMVKVNGVTLEGNSFDSGNVRATISSSLDKEDGAGNALTDDLDDLDEDVIRKLLLQAMKQHR